MMNNVHALLAYVLAHPVGHTFNCATSQYANNTTPPGFTFDAWSTPQAVRSLVQQGFIEAEYRWRYYECTVKSHSGSGLSRQLRKKLSETGSAVKKS